MAIRPSVCPAIQPIARGRRRDGFMAFPKVLAYKSMYTQVVKHKSHMLRVLITSEHPNMYDRCRKWSIITHRKSNNAIAKELNVSRHWIGRIAHWDPRYKSYVKTKVNRLIRAKLLLCKSKDAEWIRFAMMRKKLWSGSKGHQNERQLSRDPKDVLIFMHTIFPETVMVLGIWSNEGGVMPSQFFSRGLRVTAARLRVLWGLV